MRWGKRGLSITDGLAKKYKNMFSLPSQNYLLLGLIIFGTFIGFSAYGVLGRAEELGIIDGFFTLSIASVLSTFLIKVIVKDGFLTLKRIFGLAFFELLILGAILIVGAGLSRTLGDSQIFEKFYFISCGALTALGTIIVGSTVKLRIARLFVAGVSQPSFIVLSHCVVLYVFGLINNKLGIYSFVVAFLVMSVSSFFVAIWYILSIKKIGEGILGYDTLTLFRAFIGAIVLDETSLLEKMLETLAVVSKAEISIFDFNGETVKGRIVVPQIHPGPFRELGSSKLPTKLAQKLKKIGVCPLIFHSPTTHEKDLISSKECDLIINAVSSFKINDKGNGVTRSVTKKKGDVTVTCQILDGVPLVVITRSPIPTEDLPERVNEICIKKLEEMGFSNGVVVDAHNVMDNSIKEFREKDEKDLLEALRECVEDLKKEPMSKGFVGFFNSIIDDHSLSDEFGDAGIMAMVIEVNGQKTAYVVLDGNNMVVGLRERLVEILKEEGYLNSEIATTDTHVVVARKAREGYSPIGKNLDWDLITKKVIEAVKEADSNKEECCVKFSKISLDGVHFLGGQGIEKLWFVVDKSLSKAKVRTAITCFVLFSMGVLVYLFT